MQLRCEQAGLQLVEAECSMTKGKRKTVWKGLGPMSAYNFCQTNLCKKLGQGSGALLWWHLARIGTSRMC